MAFQSFNSLAVLFFKVESNETQSPFIPYVLVIYFLYLIAHLRHVVSFVLCIIFLVSSFRFSPIILYQTPIYFI